jgi:NTP pyrophosphatase (non-canonical NTP hydrolase)
MNKFINDFIKDLSIKDNKTLSQKVLKVVEEVGELAKVILPFDSAPGTMHRFSDREKILEEIVDVYLTNISILHSLGFSEDEFEEVLNRKSNKWASIQSKESEVTYPLPFEIHITVDVSEDFSRVDKFREDCVKIEVKPIVLDLEMKEGSIKDIMTSSKHFGDNRSAYDESLRIVNELKDYGYKVVRSKIESVPWHPAAPRYITGEVIPNNCYFESHIGIVIEPNEKEQLKEFVDGLNNGCTEAGIIKLTGVSKLSQNFFKKSKDGSKFVNMLTYRDNMTCKEDFEHAVDLIKWSLTECDFEFEKVEVEYAIYDTNTKHDSKWITE